MKMKFDLRNRPTRYFEMIEWFVGFEKRQKLILSEPDQWLASHKERIMARFQHHSVSGLTPEELLTYFIEEEIMGE